MSFVQAIKRLMGPDSSSQTSSSSSHSQQSPPQISPTHNNTSSTATNKSSNSSFKPLCQGLQKKYAKGVQYNMKVVIRGECNVGKTTLWSRLQGNQFHEDYVPSDEIKVANINWNYKSFDDIVKVEVWDIVDKSRKKRKLDKPLKLTNQDAQEAYELSLDAEFLDVYKNTSGVIFVYDICKQWTWDYIERELPKVPSHIPILILGNQKDLEHHRKVPQDKCKMFIEQFDRGTMGSVLKYSESSMRNGFGLQYIYQFFNIPYLQLQREALLQQLEVNARDMDQTLEEIDAYEQSQENNYEVFLDQLTQKRRIKQEQLAGDILKQAKPLEEAKKVYNENLLIQQQQQQEAAAKSGKIIPPALNGIVQTLTRKNESTIRHTPTTTTVQSSPNTMKQKPMQAVQPQIQKNLTIDPQPDESTSDITDNTINNFNPLVKTTVDDFIPDDNEYETFLVDDPASMIKSPSTYSTQTQQNKLSTTTDDENETPHINPMVVGFREQLDSDDEQQQQNTTNFDIVRTNSQKISDDEIEEEEEEDKNVQSTKPQSKPNPKSSQTISAPVVPIYNFTSSDLDMLDKMTSFSRQSTLEGSNTKTIDSQSVTSETRSTKKKSKKTSSSQEGSVDSSVKKKHHKKSKQDLSSSDEKKKKSKKTTATKMLKSMSLNEAVSHNDKNDDDKDERDLESFLGETKQHSSGGGQGDYELI